MTCIVGLVDGERVWIGADSAGVGGWDLRIRADRKIFRNGRFLFGCTTSFRMIQLLQYSLQLDAYEINDEALSGFMCTTFVDRVRDCLKGGGFARKESEAEKGGDFLVATGGRLFHVHEDYQVAEPIDAYDACGCGESYARGSLHASRELLKSHPRKRVEMALHAAEDHSAGVRGPFHITSTV